MWSSQKLSSRLLLSSGTTDPLAWQYQLQRCRSACSAEFLSSQPRSQMEGPALMMEEGRLLMIRRGSRPGQEPEVLFDARNMDEVQAFMKSTEK